LEAYLERVGVRPVVLARAGGGEQSLLQKFLQFGGEARFAIVLLTADDLGASRHQYDADGVGEKAFQFRARQNVILELGFFYGRLGWEEVFVLYKSPLKVFPNFEPPSDLGGVVWDVFDQTDMWQTKLTRRLSEAKFNLRHQSTTPS
jgi:predicted nucleotide-binding protein